MSSIVVTGSRVGTLAQITGDDTDEQLFGSPDNDTIAGAGGSDTLVGGDGDDWLFGNANNGGEDPLGVDGADSLIGGAGNDLMRGNAGNDTLLGGSGDDNLRGDAGNDLIDGGEGTDLVSYRFDELGLVAGVVFDLTNAGGPGTTTVSDGRGGTDTLVDVERFNLIGTTFGDTLIGSAGDDQITDAVLRDNHDDDSLVGGAGNDFFSVTGGNDTVVGGAGIDTLGLGYDFQLFNGPVSVSLAGLDLQGPATSLAVGAPFGTLTVSGVERLYVVLTSANDSFTGARSDDDISGGAGNDTLNGDAGSDTLTGGLGNDTYVVDVATDVISETSTSAAEIDSVRSSVGWTLGANLENLVLTGAASINGTGNGGDNKITGNGAANLLRGGSGQDLLSGGAGNDTLDGGAGSDTLIGGSGNDSYRVDLATDVISETGSTTAEVDTVLSSISWTLGANLEHLTLSGSAALSGSGNSLANLLTGNAGSNVLNGGAGNDTLRGAAGADTLAGGLGNDALTGGTGADTFLFRTPLDAGSNVDRVTDFSAVDDRLLLDDAVFAGIGPLGQIAAANFHLGAAAGDASDRVIYNAATGQLFYDADGSGAAAAVLFASVTAGTTLTAADIWIG